MAGVKGRSGRKPGPKKPNVMPIDVGAALRAIVEVQGDEGRRESVQDALSTPVTDGAGLNMLELLQAIALGKIDATALQVRAAVAAVQYTHTKRGDGGKKEEQNDKAKKVAGGKFSPAAAPRLVSSNGAR